MKSLLNFIAPVHLRRRIREFYEEKRYVGDMIDADEVFHELSFPLRKEVSLYCNRDAIKRVPFFSACEGALLEALLLKLKSRHFVAGDYIIRKGDVGNEMYILNKGEVSVVTEDGKVLATLGEGSFFGEIALLSDHSRRTASLKADINCLIYCLEKKDLADVCRKFPKFDAEIKLLANTRLAATMEKKG